MHDYKIANWINAYAQEVKPVSYAYKFMLPIGDWEGWVRPHRRRWLPNMMPFQAASNYMVLRPDGLHPAIDFWRLNESALNYPALCIGNGIVVDIVNDGEERSRLWGNLVLVKHMFIKDASLKSVYSLYAHLETIEVGLGQNLNMGDLIGKIGGTDGTIEQLNWDAHLHFEIRKKPLYANAWPSEMGFRLYGRKYLKDQVYHHPLEFIENR